MTAAGFDSLRQQLDRSSPLYLWRTPSSYNPILHQNLYRVKERSCQLK